MEKSKETIGKVVLDYSCYPGEDFYSEGAEEDALLEVVKNHTPKEYNRVIAENSRWSMLYHLSHIRGNIVDFLSIGKKDRVLEVGAGCGAITGMLAQKAGSVTSIELSRKRSLINAYRNSECENVEIRVGNFQDVEKTLSEKYDFIMLIGVFEYAESYIKSDSPYDEFLNILSKHLAQGGRIVIAIENKYGMKYWAGCKEDHVGRFYEGIEGYANSTGVRTFSKPGLEKIAKKCGFSHEFFYPYPDYKLPVTIYSDKRLPKVGELTDNIRNFDAERVVSFDEALAFDEVIREGMFPFYSNSYLMMLYKEEKVESFKTRKPIYSKHSNERADEYRIRTDIEVNGYGEHFVVKYAFTKDAEEHIRQMERAYSLQQESFQNTKFIPNRCQMVDFAEAREDGLEFEFLTGNTLEAELDQLYDEGKTEQVIEKVLEYADCVRRLPNQTDFTITPEFTERFGEVKVPGQQKSLKITNLDLIFSNIIINNGWNVIDYEWTFEFPIPLNFVIYRCAYYYFNQEKKGLLSQYDIYAKLGITEAERKVYEQMEHHFQLHIIGKKFSLIGMYSLMGRNAVKLEKLKKYGDLLPRTDRIKVYFDKGNGFGEDNTCYYTVKVTEEDRVIVDFVPDSEVVAVRIDPSAYPCMIMLHQFNGEEALVNGMVFSENTVMYHTDDPQIVLEEIEPGKPVHVEYTITMFRSDFFENIASGIEQMKSSIFWKRKGPYEKVRLSAEKR